MTEKQKLLKKSILKENIKFKELMVAPKKVTPPKEVYDRIKKRK